MKKIYFLAISTLVLGSITGQCSRDKSKDEAVAEETPVGELKIEDIKLGDGDAVMTNQRIVVHYKGQLEDGTVFSNSYDSGNPLIVTLGIGELIKGWDQGIVGMRVGGVRKLTIPPHLGYGKKGIRKVPPNSTLIFEVKLLNILH